MARGWESKSVDDQISARDSAVAERQQAEPSEAERRLASARDTLMLSRARTLQSLQTACDRRHRALLEQTLAHLDRELSLLGPR